jgi:TPP-dependent pyruvate/acetoin dehydrogenase alpha subunit
MEFTPIEDVTAGEIRARAEVLGLWNRSVDGMDVLAVREAAVEAVQHARSGAGPAFLETLTYRFVGHSRSDPGAYRKPGELDEMRKRDPLLVMRDHLTEGGAATDAELDQIDAEVGATLAEIVERALAAPFPAADSSATEYKDGATT